MSNKTILHLGSGKCSELNEYLASDAKKIILVEANPSIITSLQKKVRDLKRVEVLDLAVFDQANGKLNVFNLFEASSLHEPTGLVDLFPGLQTVNVIKVKVKSSAEIVTALQINENDNNLLVIDSPGEEFNILKKLADNKLLHLFSQIKLHCGVVSLYNGAKNSNEILVFLRELGYDVLYQDDEIDPDRPCWTLQINTLALENKMLKAQLIQLKLEVISIKDECQSKLTKVTLERDAQVKSTNNKIIQINQLTKRRDELSLLLENHQQQIKRITKDKDEQVQIVLDRQNKIEQFNKSFEQQKKQLINELEKIKQTKVELQKDLATARQTTSLSIKLQTLKEADLKDLQKKYSEALIVQDNQYQLLAKLSERLSLASNYFHQMSENQSDITGERKDSVQVKSQSQRFTKKRLTRRRQK